MPGPHDAGIDRGKAVQRHQQRGDTIAQPAVDHLVDASVIGIEDRRPPRLGRRCRDPFIAGDDRRLAEARDRARRLRRTIAVDHQPRITLRDQMRVELFRQRIRNPGNADIPGDVPLELAPRQPEIAKRTRDGPAVMVTGQQERRAPRAIILAHRRNILAVQE